MKHTQVRGEKGEIKISSKKHLIRKKESNRNENERQKLESQKT